MLRSVRIRKVLLIALCWTCIQVLLYLNTYFSIYDLVMLDKLEGSYAFWPDFFGNAVIGIFGGLVGGYMLVYRVNAGFKQRTFLSGILKSAAYFVLLYAGGAVCILFLMGFIFHAIQSGITDGMQNAYENLKINLATPSFFVVMVIWALLVSGSQFILQVNDKFGQGVLWKFLTGRYYHPLQEERIFMFLDLQGSTAIAERLGTEDFFALLRDLYADMTGPIVAHAGEIYQYIGDEVVVSWHVGHGITRQNCLRCFFSVKDVLARRSVYYHDTYNHIPVVKAGMHIGIATVGEIGIIKKDIVYSGDVLNTTSRIQGECNHYRAGLLISKDLLDRLENTDPYEAKLLGEIHLRGKASGMQLFAIQRNVA